MTKKAPDFGAFIFWYNLLMKKGYKVLLFVLGIILGAGVFYSIKKGGSSNSAVSCTAEAMICPDGTAVGRSGPKCEFSKCPEIKIDPAWEIFKNNQINFRYPKDLGSKYISVVDWPPKAQIINEPFSCLDAGNENARAGQTENKIIKNRIYCVTKISEGAAGSIYTNYAYEIPYKNGALIFTFSLRKVQCGNYDEKDRLACENEQSSFNIDNIMAKIVESIDLAS